jgi:hypothetical protein
VGCFGKAAASRRHSKGLGGSIVALDVVSGFDQVRHTALKVRCRQADSISYGLGRRNTEESVLKG